MSKIYWKDIDQRALYIKDINKFNVDQREISGYIQFIKILYPVRKIIKNVFYKDKDVVNIINEYTDCVIDIMYILNAYSFYNYKIMYIFIDSHNFLLDTYGMDE